MNLVLQSRILSSLYVCSYVWTGHYFNLISYIQLWVLRAKWFLSKTLVFNFWSKLPNMALTWWYSSIFSWRFTSKWMKVNHDISNVGKSHTFPQSKTNWKILRKEKDWQVLLIEKIKYWYNQLKKPFWQIRWPQIISLIN